MRAEITQATRLLIIPETNAERVLIEVFENNVYDKVTYGQLHLMGSGLNLGLPGRSSLMIGVDKNSDIERWKRNAKQRAIKKLFFWRWECWKYLQLWRWKLKFED